MASSTYLLFFPFLVVFVCLSNVAAITPPINASLLPIVHTKFGAVQGFLDNATTPVPLQKWYGIRYGQDTSGTNLWCAPKQPAFDDLVFNATAFGPACMQRRPPATAGAGTEIQSEDCLRVNVIAPLGAKRLPVYIYS
jgi:carboxylesterase type B